jgi:hypothetical protein
MTQLAQFSNGIEAAIVAIPPKTITGRMTLCPYDLHTPGLSAVVRLPVRPWIEVDIRDSEGFPVCYADDCQERLGSPWCPHGTGADEQFYTDHRAFIDGQRTPEQIVRESPVNQPAVSS